MFADTFAEFFRHVCQSLMAGPRTAALLFFGWGLGWLGWPSWFLRHSFAVENLHSLKKRSFTLSSPQCSAKDLATFWRHSMGQDTKNMEHMGVVLSILPLFCSTDRTILTKVLPYCNSAEHEECCKNRNLIQMLAEW